MGSIKRVAIFILFGAGIVACYSPMAPTTVPIFTPSLITTQEPTPTLTGAASTETAAPMEPIGDLFDQSVSPADITFMLPPTVQHVSETGAVIHFELDAPGEGALFYRPVGGPISSHTLQPDRTAYHITLTGLLPATTYEYAVRIGADGDYRQPLFSGESWGTGAFRTPPYGPPMRIGVIGDSGYGQPVTYALAERMASFNPDFVIHTGDVVYEMAEDSSPHAAYARKFYAPFAPVLQQAPVYPVVGNHDVLPETFWEGDAFYYHAFPPIPDSSADRRQWYALEFGDVQIVMLDTQTFYGEGRREEQQVWLEERLADPRFSITITVFHVPPYGNGLHPNDGLPVQAAWVPLLKSANVPLVLCGHEHYYERLIINDVTYVTTGGGSAILYAPGEPLLGSQIVSRLSHFVLLEVFPDHIALRAINAEGAVIDQAIISLLR